MNKKFRELIKDTFIFSLGSLGSKLILFILVPLYTNYLTTAEYGIAELVFTIAQLLIPIASVTIWNGLIRFGLMKDQCPESVFKNSFLICIFGSVLIVFSTPLIGFYSPICEWKWYLSIYSIVYIFTFVELNYLKVIGKNKLFSLMSVVQTLLLAILNILLLVSLKMGVKGYLLSNIIANFVIAFLIFFVGKIYFAFQKGHFDYFLLKSLLKYSAPLIMNDISWWFIHSSDKIMIEWMVSKNDLGLYTVASKIPGLINTFVSIFSQSWGISSIKEIESTNDTSYFSKVFYYYSTLSFFAAIGFISIIKPFMQIYVGIEFIDAWRFVPLLLVAAAFSAISTYYGSMFGALKKSVECMWSTIVGAILNVVLNYIFIRRIGTWGAIVGTVCALFTMAFIRMIWVNYYIKMKIYWNKLIIDFMILFADGIIISLDWNIIIVSIGSMLLFILNHNDILQLLYTVVLKQKNKREPLE